LVAPTRASNPIKRSGIAANGASTSLRRHFYRSMIAPVD
jgi:hypothetical protein